MQFCWVYIKRQTILDILHLSKFLHAISVLGLLSCKSVKFYMAM